MMDKFVLSQLVEDEPVCEPSPIKAQAGRWGLHNVCTTCMTKG